jgi:RNA 2',3'-cyclic 3'-phosphodiesterase
MGIRLFLAFELPPEIREQIGEISRELRKSRLPARWVREENIHLTIVFLGSVQENVVEDLKETVGSVARGFTGFSVTLGSTGVFPGLRRPRVFWIGLRGDIERLSRLRDELQKVLRVFGIQEETRPFRAHLTLGRFKDRFNNEEELARIIDRYCDISSTSYSLDELVLFRSDLKPSGPMYTKMASWPLTGH